MFSGPRWASIAESAQFAPHGGEDALAMAMAAAARSSVVTAAPHRLRWMKPTSPWWIGARRRMARGIQPPPTATGIPPAEARRNRLRWPLPARRRARSRRLRVLPLAPEPDPVLFIAPARCLYLFKAVLSDSSCTSPHHPESSLSLILSSPSEGYPPILLFPVASPKKLAASLQILKAIAHIVGYLTCDLSDRGLFSEYNQVEMTSLHDVLEKKLQDPNATPMFLPIEFLKTITCDFSTESELGRGGYGVVYKGVLRSGKIIAVKKRLETLIKHEAFQNEISFLMGIKHQNVVQFVGYCAESRWEAIEQPSGSGRHILAEIQKRLLCFEYVSNKSLDRHIADRSLDLEWNIRYKIIIGICNGLHFLHEECRIIHLDLKPENILMDSNMKPKIADFDLSRLFREQQSKVFTDNRAGTRGYMAPEYINQGLITKKADIFSLGVIIIEIVTGRRDYPNFQLDSPESTATSCQHFTEEVLGSWRYKFESRVKFISMEKYIQQVKECISIALKCVDPGMEKRPTVKDVIQVLKAVDKMEASKDLPSEMQCMDKSRVLDTNASNELILHSITEDMSNIKTCDTVGEVKKSQDCLLPTPLWMSSTSSQTHQEAAKVSSEPQQSSDKTSELIPDSSMILDIHPVELCFFYEPDKLITCSLDITNNTDEKMAFTLEKKSSEETCFLSRWPKFGVMDPRTTYTLVLIMDKHMTIPRQRNVDLILHTSTYCESSSDEDTCIQHFQNAERLGIIVHQATLKCVCAPRGVTIFEVSLSY
ncbi:hypothetical protein ACQ4PT_014955 [Festuca glaucescens]